MKKFARNVLFWILIAVAIYTLFAAVFQYMDDVRRIQYVPVDPQSVVEIKQGRVLPATATPMPQKPLDVTTSTMQGLVNAERKAAGLQPVTELVHINAGAVSRAKYLIDNKQWSHAGYENAMRNTLWNPSSAFIGEDLANEFTSDSAVIRAWMNSPKHKAIILDGKYKYMGFGHYQDHYVLWMSSQP